MKLIPLIVFISTSLCINNLYASSSTPTQTAIDAADISNEIYIYDFAYGGTGCPQGTLSAELTSDYQSVQLFFEDYSADSTQSDRGRMRQSCNLGVAVHVPQGLTVGLIALTYEGYVDVAPQAYTSLQAEYFFAGEPTSINYRKEWYSDSAHIQHYFTDKQFFPFDIVTWSPCGEDAIIRANTSIKAYESHNGDAAYININSLSASASIIYQLVWQEC